LFATTRNTSTTIASAGTVYWVTSSFQLTHPEDGAKIYTEMFEDNT
jgi:hypothetical protein